MRAEVEIRKIANGYILRINGLETFCDVPEAICGLTSEWVLAQCQRLDEAPKDAGINAQLAAAMQAMASVDVGAKVRIPERLVEMQMASLEEPFGEGTLRDSFRRLTDLVRRK